MANKPYIFISYAHFDNSIVLPCINAMQQSGINLWYDEGIEAGSEWPEFIAEKVVDCTKFVLFVSNAYLNSQNCKRELNFAISRKKEILSIFIDEVTLSPGMEMQLGTYQAIYKNRFNSTSAFHNSICKESFFNVCRLSNMQTTVPEHRASYTDAVRATSTGFASASPAKNKCEPRPKNKYIAGLLAIFLGSLGAHKFYLKRTKTGIVYLLFFWAYVPGIISFFEGLALIFSSDEKFNAKYNT